VNGFALENVEGLKTTLSDRQERHRTATAKVTALETQIDSLNEKLEGLSDAKPDEKLKAKLEAERDQLIQKHTNELNELKGNLKKSDGLLRKYALEARADAAIAVHAADANAGKLLRPHVLSQLDMRTTDAGDVEVFVRGADGNPRLSMQSGQNGPMSVEEYVESMKTDDAFALAFKGSGASGSGAAGSSGAGGAGSNGNHVISAEDARDTGKYRAAKEQAEKAGRQLVIAD